MTLLTCLWALAAAAAVSSVTGWALGGIRAKDREDVRVEYTVRLENPQTQMIDMTMSLRGVPSTLDVMLPVWRPGRYEVLDSSGAVRGVTATTGDGRPVYVEKTDKATWRLTLPESADDVVVSYRVYANSIANRTRHVDDTHAFLSPACVFMYAPMLRASPLRVVLDGPAHWSVATGLQRADGDERTLVAPDYDVLVDSPIEFGEMDKFDFDVDGVPHQIAVWWGGHKGSAESARGGEFYGSDRLSKDFSKLIRQQREMFGSFPYSSYVFLVHCYATGGGGTEHLNSTIVGCRPEAFSDEKRYHAFLQLISHEFFHTWNVKQFRPEGLKPYDYQHENYTTLLWVAEGATSYYEDIMLVRSGLYKATEVLDGLRDSIVSQRKRPGGGVQSLSESSFDAWVKFNKPSPDAANSTVSFYDKGALASFALDMLIRSSSEGRGSLDAVMKDLYERYPYSGPAYSERDLIALASSAAGSDVSDFFENHIRGTDPIDFDAALAAVGLKLVHVPAKHRDRADDAYLGMTVDSRGELATVTAVLSDGPAYDAGIVSGDIIIALNGHRVRPADWDASVKRLEPGLTAKLTLFRMDVLREIEVSPFPRQAGTWKIERVHEPTDLQKRAYESWLGVAWSGAKGNGTKGSDILEDKGE